MRQWPRRIPVRPEPPAWGLLFPGAVSGTGTAIWGGDVNAAPCHGGAWGSPMWNPASWRGGKAPAVPATGGATGARGTDSRQRRCAFRAGWRGRFPMAIRPSFWGEGGDRRCGRVGGAFAGALAWCVGGVWVFGGLPVAAKGGCRRTRVAHAIGGTRQFVWGTSRRGRRFPAGGGDFGVPARLSGTFSRPFRNQKSFAEGG